MGYYPVYLKLIGKKCLVLGGGDVAGQKVKALVEAKAKVTVISPQLTSRLRATVKRKRINYFPRRYRQGDLKGVFLAYDATGDPAAHRVIVKEARAAGVLLNVVDRPGLCTFIAPAVVKRGDFMLAVSTGGASPALAKKVRQKLEISFGPEYEPLLKLLSALRKRLRQANFSPAARRRVLAELVNSSLPRYVKRRDKSKVERLLSRVIGRGWNLRRLGVRL